MDIKQPPLPLSSVNCKEIKMQIIITAPKKTCLVVENAKQTMKKGIMKRFSHATLIAMSFRFSSNYYYFTFSQINSFHLHGRPPQCIHHPTPTILLLPLLTIYIMWNEITRDACVIVSVQFRIPLSAAYLSIFKFEHTTCILFDCTSSSSSYRQRTMHF